MRKLLSATLLLLVLAVHEASAQYQRPARMNEGNTFSSMTAPTGCVSTSVPFFGTDIKLGCDSGLTYDPSTDTLTSTGTIAARNLTATALATPVITAVTPVGTPGVTTYGYVAEACLASGECSPSAVVTTTTGHATLDGTNSVTVTWGAVTGAATYKLTRVTGTPAGGDAPPRLLYTGTALTFSDTNATSTSEAVATVNETGVLWGGGLRLGTSATAGHVLTADAAGYYTPQAGGGGVTNSAGANVIPKSDGANLVASAISEASAGALATSAGTALGLTATAPAATTGASQAGKDVAITASPAVASTDTTGAAAGGSVTITAGAAARNTNGNGDGGDVNLVPGAAVGIGRIGQVLVPTGSTTAPAIANVGATGTGISFPTTSQIALLSGSNTRFLVNALYFQGGSTGAFCLSSGAATATCDTFWTRAGAAKWRMGEADAAVPVAQTLTVQKATGTNAVAPAFSTLESSASTGNAAGSGWKLQSTYTAFPNTAATTQLTQSDRFVYSGKWAALTAGVATGIADVTVPVSGVSGGELLVLIEANDGTEYQALASRVRWSTATKATGNPTGAVSVIGTDLQANSSGTGITATYTVTAAAGKITIETNAASDLTETTLRANVQVISNGPGVTVTPL